VRANGTGESGADIEPAIAWLPGIGGWKDRQLKGASALNGVDATRGCLGDLKGMLDCLMLAEDCVVQGGPGTSWGGTSCVALCRGLSALTAILADRGLISGNASELRAPGAELRAPGGTAPGGTATLVGELVARARLTGAATDPPAESVSGNLGCALDDIS